ncbi:hypothetical protein GH714_027824 [Hevea brasiliensis]|uniref:non-specific serine/threonine protein kinase n=1 Tax=Hevea brasiliensis TaxID=3981 RepID=A0A6A6KRM1_HEVBR|nr:hypothetical protein GH714_027824 [Hevea brasiliensis]
MTHNPSYLTIVFIITAITSLLYTATVVDGLGSASTIAVTYSTATVCGIIAGEPIQRIQCYQNGHVISIQPSVSFESISGGQTFFCGLRSGGFSVFCWETVATTNSSFQPKRIYHSNNIQLTDLTVGDDQVCAREVNSGIAKCWRGKGRGRSPFPLPAVALKFSTLTSGSGFTCGILRNNSRVYCWGNNDVGAAIQRQFANLKMLNLVAGESHACGLNASGFLVCKGSNGSGQLDVPFSSAFAFSGSCVQSSCGTCGVYPDSEVLCDGSGNISSIINPNLKVNAAAMTNNGSTTPSLRSYSVRHQSSRRLGRQRSGSSSKRTDKTQKFFLSELVAATNNFSSENKIGAGSFGIVYKGKLANGFEVAIKRGETGTKTKKFQEKESAFDSELALLSRLHHKHLVELVGFCEEKDERLLVYEYMSNGSLHSHLHNNNNVEKSSSILNSWKMRIKIALDAATGINYLHNYAVPPIIHRDIKSSNILLDANWSARVSDFGLSLMGPESDQEFMSTKAVGTVGYIDPEYYVLNVLTAKSDVYGLGVVLLELLTGKRAVFKTEEGAGPMGLVEYVSPLILSGEMQKVLDKRVGPPEMHEAEAVELMAYTAMHCVSLEGKKRPDIVDIVANLERALGLYEEIPASFSTISFSIPSSD